MHHAFNSAKTLPNIKSTKGESPIAGILVPSGSRRTTSASKITHMMNASDAVPAKHIRVTAVPVGFSLAR
jgi:hypothetical protein